MKVRLNGRESKTLIVKVGAYQGLVNSVHYCIT